MPARPYRIKSDAVKRNPIQYKNEIKRFMKQTLVIGGRHGETGFDIDDTEVT